MGRTCRCVRNVQSTMVVDGSTGEVTEHQIHQVFSVPVEPPYVKFYLGAIGYLSDITGTASSVLYELIKHMSYAGDEDGMMVFISAGLKRMIQKRLKLSNVSSVNNSITQLVKSKILLRVDRGAYRVNPYVFGRGEWKDISKLRAQIDISYSKPSGEEELK